MKKCSECKEEKESTDFSKCLPTKDGLQYKCKTCDSTDKKDRCKTKLGKLRLIYKNQINTSKRRNHEPPKYTKKEFIDRFVNDLDFERHYYSWVISNYSKEYSPSFDRLDDYKGYSFDNIQIMYWFENNAKGYSDTKNGINNKQSKAVIGIDIKTGYVIEFHSSMEAQRNGFIATRITKCCKKTAVSHKGYVWSYKNKK